MRQRKGSFADFKSKVEAVASRAKTVGGEEANRMVQDKDKEGGPGKSYQSDCETIAQRATWLLASAQAVQDKTTAAVQQLQDLGPKLAGRRESMLANLETMLDADYVGADLRPRQETDSEGPRRVSAVADPGDDLSGRHRRAPTWQPFEERSET